MAEVLHRYIGRGDKVPAPTPAERKERAAERKADAELVKERSEGLRVRRMSAQLLLAKARQELIPKAMARQQAGFLLVGLQRKILAIPQSYARKLLDISDYETMAAKLKEMSILILREIEDLPSAIEPGWRGNLDEEETPTK